jgi:multiple sugar transport system ATP-binding protein
MRLAPAGAGGLRGRVVLVEHLGAESVITVRLSDPDVVHAEENQANEVLVSEPGYSDLHTDDEVDVEVGLASAILFDPESGDRLPDVAEAPRANAVAGARGDQR